MEMFNIMSPDVPHTGKTRRAFLVWDHFALIQHLPDEKLVSNDIRMNPEYPLLYITVISIVC